MSKEWKALEIKIILDLLEELRDRFSNDGCNDLDDEQQDFAEIVNLTIEDEDDHITSNSDLVTYFQNKFKNITPVKEAKASKEELVELGLLRKQLTEKDAQIRELNSKIKKLGDLDEVKKMIEKIQKMKVS